MMILSEIAGVQQHQEFLDLLAQLGEAIPSEIEETLSLREQVEPPSELTTQVVNQFDQLLKNKSQSFETNG